MTAQSNSATAPELDAEFHAVAWVRGVRDQMYAATSTLSAKELIEFVRQAALAARSSPDKSSADGRTV